MAEKVVLACAAEVDELRDTGERTDDGYPVEETVKVPCGLEVDRVEIEDDFPDEGDALVQAIAAGKVKGRAKETYVCPAGHVGKVEVAE